MFNVEINLERLLHIKYWGFFLAHLLLGLILVFCLPYVKIIMFYDWLDGLKKSFQIQICFKYYANKAGPVDLPFVIHANLILHFTDKGKKGQRF